MAVSLIFAALALLAPRPTPTPEVRRILIRAPEAFASSPEAGRLAARGPGLGAAVRIEAEHAAAPKGWETADVGLPPASDRFRSIAAAFPLAWDETGFTFDGRTYGGPDDAILVADPATPLRAVVYGNSAKAAARLLGRRLFGLHGEGRGPDYEVASGELGKTGRFVRAGGRLEVDRASDRDAIAEREAFFAALKPETRGGVVWEARDSERAAAAKWEKAAALPARSKGRVRIRVFPDAATKGLYAGSTRPADLSDGGGGEALVALDASASDSPDRISPVLAAAALAATRPALMERPTLLLAAGARRAGTWWGRPVRGFGAFARAAAVEPTVEEVIGSGAGVSPVLAVGAAASWLDAGVRL